MAGRPCLSCKSPNRLAIDAAIQAGRTLEAIASEFGTTVSRLRSHIRAGHVTTRTAPPVDLEPGLLDLKQLLDSRLEGAVRFRDYRATALLAREMRKLLEDVRAWETVNRKPATAPNPFKTKAGRALLAEILALFETRVPARVAMLRSLIEKHAGTSKKRPPDPMPSPRAGRAR